MNAGYLPYRTPTPDYFRTFLKINGETLPEDGIIKGWSPEGKMIISADVEIDSFFNLHDFIQKDAAAVLIASWYCKDGNHLRGKIASAAIKEGILEYNLSGAVDNTLLSGSVIIDIALAVDSPGKADDPLKADSKGLMLWRHENKIILEGGVSYFPAADISFKENRFPPDAFFHLEKHYKDIDVPFTSNYQLLINNKHPLFKKINEPGKSIEDKWIRGFFEYSVIKNVIEDALHNEDFLEWAENENNIPEPLSTAAVYKHLLEQTFDGIFSIEKINHEYLNKKNHFETRIQNKYLRSE